MTIRRFVTGALATAAVAATTQFAAAADMARAVPRAVPQAAMAQVLPFYNWTGFYIGAHAGWATGEIDTGIPGGTLDQDGWFAGGQIGYNWQSPFSNWVFGLEVDSAFAGIEGDESALLGIVTASVTSEVQWLGSARGRIGYAWDRWLPYVTGGVAWANNEVTASAAALGVAVSATDDQTHVGWTLGAGLEWIVAPRWSAKVEYLYYDLGEATYFGGAGGGVDADISFHTVKFGLNYRFN